MTLRFSIASQSGGLSFVMGAYGSHGAGELRALEAYGSIAATKSCDKDVVLYGTIRD